jgi:NADPH:quinone reductase-like Zn-dependent oxidoreductase
LIEQWKVKVIIEETFPLSEAKQAHDAIERRHTQGKIVLTV